jgi:hypothetical protein
MLWTFIRINHRLHHKTSLDKFKWIEIIQSTFPNHSRRKIEIKNRRKFEKFTNIWKLNTILLNNQWLKEDFHSNNRNYLRIHENKLVT